MIERITYRIESDNGIHIHFSLWVNGALICIPGGLCLRKEEFNPFIKQLKAISDSKWYDKNYGNK